MDEIKDSDEPTCKNCRFYVRHEYENLDVILDHGECRRYPPKRLNVTESGFPTVIDDCLCGEYDSIM